MQLASLSRAGYRSSIDGKDRRTAPVTLAYTSTRIERDAQHSKVKQCCGQAIKDAMPLRAH